jgi:hypothetical protein
MKINRHNYELFFLDYYDDQMNASEKEMLFEFLELNPDLKQEFDHFEMIALQDSAPSVVFPLKEELKRPEITSVGKINESNYQEYFISWHEGDLLHEEQTQILSFINSNPQLDEEFELFGKLKLQPDLNIAYSPKQKLIQPVQTGSVRLYLRYAVSAAAVFLLVFTVFQQLNNTWKQDFQTAGLLMQNSKDQLPDVDNNQSDNLSTTETISLAYNYYKSAPDNVRIKSETSPSRIDPITASQIPAGITSTHSPSPRSEFSETYSAMTEKQRSAPEENNPSFIQQPRLFDNVISQVKGNYDNTTNKLASFNGWKIAEYGVMGFNALTDNNVNFNVQNNDQGEVSKVAFNDFAFPIRRNR